MKYFTPYILNNPSYNFRVTTQLKETTKEGFKIIFWKLLDMEPSHFVHSDILKYYCMILDLWLRSEGTILGHVMVVDMQGVILGHVGRLSPMTTKKFLYYLQDALPVRLKGLHFINAGPAMDLIFAMSKPFMKKELLNIVSNYL